MTRSGLGVEVNTQPSWLVNTRFSSVIRTSAMHNTDSRFIILCVSVCVCLCVSGSGYRLAPIYFFQNTCHVCACVCGCVCVCKSPPVFLSVDSPLARIYFWACVFACVRVLASPVCMCLCVLLLKDLHCSVSPPSIKSCLVPVCHVTKD